MDAVLPTPFLVPLPCAAEALAASFLATALALARATHLPLPVSRTFCRPVLPCAGGPSLPDLTPHLSTAVCSPLSGPPRGPRPGARILKPRFVYLRSAVSIEEYPLLLLRFPIGYAATCRSLERLTAPKYLPCGGVGWSDNLFPSTGFRI
ncbi:hypothetical protein BHM03_00028727 [Ensete ventricosum]|nr:hypothetical protein BHM03_00028727 [Ensete ventricosum]